MYGFMFFCIAFEHAVLLLLGCCHVVHFVFLFSARFYIELGMVDLFCNDALHALRATKIARVNSFESAVQPQKCHGEIWIFFI